MKFYEVKMYNLGFFGIEGGESKAFFRNEENALEYIKREYSDPSEVKGGDSYKEFSVPRPSGFKEVRVIKRRFEDE